MERINSEIWRISFDKPGWNAKVLYKGSLVRMPQQDKNTTVMQIGFFFY